MKHWVIFLLIMYNFAVLGWAQSSKDSLLQIVKDKTVPDSVKAKAYVRLVAAHSRTNNIQAIKYGNEALAIPFFKENDLCRGDVLLQIGIANLSMGNKDEALQYYFDALWLFEENKDVRRMADAYNTIGRFFRKTDFEKSIRYYEQSMAIYQELKDKEGIAVILNESGVAYEYAGFYDTAIQRYQSSLAIQEERNDSLGIGYSLEFLSGAFALKGNLDKALAYNLQALAIRSNMQDSFALCLNNNSLGSIFLQKKDWHAAITHLEASNTMATKMHYLDIFPDNYKKLAQAYEAIGKQGLALAHFKLYNQYNDSIFTLEKNRQIESLNLQYETAKNKLTIQQQHLDIVRKNNILLLVFFIALAGITTGVFIYKRKQRKQIYAMRNIEKVQQEKLSKAVIEAEDEERQRIARDLHDGVGQMMSAARMNLSVLENQLVNLPLDHQMQFEKISNLVDDSCKELRIVSHNMMPNSLIKNSLTSAVRNFIDQLDNSLLKVHLYTEGLDKRLDLNIESVFYRVIQECVNNVIKHAKADKLDISIIKEGDFVSAVFEDNGVGFDKNEIEQFEGIGLKNIITRVLYLKGSIDIDTAKGQGTVIAIHIPT